MRMIRIACCVLAATLLCTAEPPASKDDDVYRQVSRSELSIEGRFGNLSDPVRMDQIGVTRSGYLDGFGAVFALEVMLVPVQGLSPFRPSVTEKEKRDLNLRKRQRLEDLEVLARQILVEEGGRLTAVPLEEKIALIVSLFHYGWEDWTGLPAQLVMQATRQTLVDRKAGDLDKPSFKKRLQVRYF